MRTLFCFCLVLQLAVSSAYAEKVVFLTGDDEYRSEESMPMIAKILGRDYGFETAVGFSLDDKGHINPTAQQSVTMTEELTDADLMVMFLRYRRPSEEVFANILNYIEAGKPIVAFRTSTHAFRFEEARGRNDWGYQNDPKAIHSLAGGAKVRELLGQSWIIHHGHFDDGKNPLTKVAVRANQKSHPILRGVEPFEAYSWLYHVQGGGDSLAGDPVLLLDGTSLRSRHADKGNTDRYPLTNPVAWTKTHTGKNGKTGRVFTTTLGHSYDFRLAPVRRIAIQGMLWALEKEDKIPQAGVNTDVVGVYEPSNSGFGEDKFKRGMTPDMVLGNQVPTAAKGTSYKSELFDSIELIYEEDFNDAKNGPLNVGKQWVIRQQTQWNVKDGILTGGLATEEYQKMMQAKKDGHDGTRTVIFLKPVPKAFVVQMRVRYNETEKKGRDRGSLLDLGHHVNSFIFGKDQTKLTLQKKKKIFIKGEFFPLNEWNDLTIEIKEGVILIQVNDRKEIIKDPMITLKTDEPVQQIDFKGQDFGTVQIDWVKLFKPVE